MVAELLKRQLLVIILSFLLGSFVISGSCQTLILTMLGPKGLQPSTFEGGLDDLESFQAWAEEIKTYMSQANPPLYEVLGQTVKASQDILKENHRALRVLQAKIARSSMTEQELTAAGALNEEDRVRLQTRT